MEELLFIFIFLNKILYNIQNKYKLSIILVKYIKFINTANNILSSGPELSSFHTTISVDPGKVVVFNDRAVHRGGATVDTQRLVLRFIANGTRLEDK